MGINSNLIPLTGVKSTKAEHLSPISKYLVKNKDEIDISHAADPVSHSSQQPGTPLQQSQEEASTCTATTVRVETSKTDAPSTPKPVKSVGECRKDTVRRERVITVKKERKGGSDNSVSGREDAARVEETGKGSRTGRRGRRVVHTQDEDYVPVR